jgi:hypothetical protein
MKILEQHGDGSQTIQFEVGDRVRLKKNQAGSDWLVKAGDLGTVIRAAKPDEKYPSTAFVDFHSDKAKKYEYGPVSVPPWDLELVEDEGTKPMTTTASMIDTLAKSARILCEDELVNSDSTLQAIVGDPADARTSTFVQFKPNPGTMQLPNPLSPIEGDEIFFAYMIPGAIFQAHDGTEWWIESYASSDQIEITNRWYPRLGGIVSINDIRRSIHQWIEPVTQTVPPPPPGIDYGALPVKIVDGPERYGAGDEITDMKKNDNTGGW